MHSHTPCGVIFDDSAASVLILVVMEDALAPYIGESKGYDGSSS